LGREVIAVHRRLFALALPALTIGFVVLAAPHARAQEAGEAIQGRVFDDTKRNTPPVPNVRVVVRRGGEVVGEARTDENGAFVVAVPGPGRYEVRLDTRTIAARFPEPAEAVLPDVQVQPSQRKFVLFPLGEADVGGPSDFDRFLNLLVSGLRFGLIIALAAVGLSLVFGTTGLMNFAHGELVTFGALVAWYLNARSGDGLSVTLVVAGLLAAVAGGMFGVALERGLWRPLRRRRTGAVALIVVSIGLALFLRSVYQLIFESGPRAFSEYATQSPWNLGPVDLLPKEAVSIALSIAVLVLVGVGLLRTRIGTGIRAVSDNADLSESSGIDVQRTILAVWVLAAATSALAGVLLGTTAQGVQYDMGFRILLLIFAAVVVGGLGTAFGAMLGGILIGVVTEVSTLWIDTDFKTAIALGVLIVVLLVRPQGILGQRERVG
jgi:neutral amino acid transport system permease protein